MPRVHRVLDKVALLSKKAKSKLVLGAVASAGAINATAADLTMGTDGAVTGTINLSNVYVVGAAVFGALAAIAVVSIAFKMIRKVA